MRRGGGPAPGLVQGHWPGRAAVMIFRHRFCWAGSIIAVLTWSGGFVSAREMHFYRTAMLICEYELIQFLGNNGMFYHLGTSIG